MCMLLVIPKEKSDDETCIQSMNQTLQAVFRCFEHNTKTTSCEVGEEEKDRWEHSTERLCVDIHCSHVFLLQAMDDLN